MTLLVSTPKIAATALSRMAPGAHATAGVPAAPGCSSMASRDAIQSCISIDIARNSIIAYDAKTHLTYFCRGSRDP